jgi:phosphatidylserine/phosphatidylglycerophosphate/cardiolipin synthase-like enzyme
LQQALLELLDDVIASDDEIHAALFELGDEELVSRLEQLGGRAHVVLSNGSITAHKHEPTAAARKRDENEDARKRLLAKGVDVGKTDRFISPGALGHNKFLVVSDAGGTPYRAWTGSTNWSTTGLCTQLNNGLLIDDRAIALAYREQWKALREAKSAHPGSLAAGNGLPTLAGNAAVHFTRAVGGVDLDALGEIVRGANEGVLFLMFIPGNSGVLQQLEKLADDKPELLIRGVVSELPKGREDERAGPSTTVRVTLFGTPKEPIMPARDFDVVQPEGMDHPAAGWAVETTHNQFTSGVGYAIIHSKVLVVDPLSDEPTVVTGSHNFSKSASGSNDENFIVVKGDKALAEAYAVNVEAAYHHYAGRASGNAHATLTGVDFLRARLEDQRREERFWRIGTGAPVRART